MSENRAQFSGTGSLSPSLSWSENRRQLDRPLTEVVPLGIEHLTVFKVPPDWLGRADVVVRPNPDHPGGEPLACVGFRDRGAYAEVGLVLTKAARRDPVALVRAARAYLDGLKEVRERPEYHTLRTLVAVARPDDRRTARWMWALGFRFQGVQLDGHARYVRIDDGP